MFIIPELKLNKFKLVDIPKVSSLYQRYGKTGLPSTNCYSGDESNPLYERKTDQISRSIEDYEAYAREQSSKGA